MSPSRSLPAWGMPLGVVTASQPRWPGGEVTRMTWPLKVLTALMALATLAALRSRPDQDARGLERMGRRNASKSIQAESSQEIHDRELGVEDVAPSPYALVDAVLERVARDGCESVDDAVGRLAASRR
jgi:hypothetical protein